MSSIQQMTVGDLVRSGKRYAPYLSLVAVVALVVALAPGSAAPPSDALDSLSAGTSQDLGGTLDGGAAPAAQEPGAVAGAPAADSGALAGSDAGTAGAPSAPDLGAAPTGGGGGGGGGGSAAQPAAPTSGGTRTGSGGTATRRARPRQQPQRRAARRTATPRPAACACRPSPPPAA